MTKKAKRYYWLKLKEDFFRQKEIKKLRKLAGGDTYTIIYLKMLLLAIKNDNKLYFEGVEDDFADELALELDEDEGNVSMTLAFLKKQNLIEEINEEEFFLPQGKELTGSETESAARVRKHRKLKENESKPLQCNANLLQGNSDITDCNKNVTTEKEKELEKDKEIDIELDSKIEDNQTNEQTDNNLSDYSILYEKNIGLINQITAEWLMEISQTIDFPLFKRGVEICTERGKISLGYLKGVIKRWVDNNITTYEQLKAYELQRKANQKPKKEFNLKIDSLGADDDNRPATQEELDELARLEEMLEGE